MKDEIMKVINDYDKALTLLDDYDHMCLKPVKGKVLTYKLEYDECRMLIDSMKFDSSLFGLETDGSFKSSISTIYQTAFGSEVYPSVEEKAANLLYFIVKNHSFCDGNKRIAASLFLYFLDRNDALYLNGKKVFSDEALVATTILIAESKPEEKDTIIRLITNFIYF